MHTFSENELVAARYRVVRLIAASGSGEIYEAEDVERQQRVAVQTLTSLSGAEMRRVVRDLELARTITHPNILRTYAVAEHERAGRQPVTLAVTELAAGTTLARYLRERTQLTTAAALPIVQQLAAGLHAAHCAGLVHGELRPDNIVITTNGNDVAVQISAFGLGRLASGSAAMSLTVPGAIVAPAAYVAPEQLMTGNASMAADIYSLGVVMYEMVTGARPYRGADTLAAILAQKSTEPPTPPHMYAPQLEPRWETVILRCLERDPRNRFVAVREAVDALTGEGPIGDRRATRNRGVLLTAAVLMLVAIGGGALQYRASRQEIEHPASGPRVLRIVPRPSVAVVALRNSSGRADQAWLATALSEMLVAELGTDGHLRVITGEDVQRAMIELDLTHEATFAPATVLRIHRNLGAEVIVFGAYSSGATAGAVRLDVQLRDLRDEQPHPVISEEGTETQLHELAARAGGRLRKALGVEAAPPVPALPRNPAVARLYARGLDALRGFDAVSARSLLERAAALEPNGPLVHAALSQTWSNLGYEHRARAAAKRALDTSTELPRDQRLIIEAADRESVSDWPRVVDIYRALTSFSPDNVDYALRLAAAQTRSGDASGALNTVNYLRRLPVPLGSDPRIDLAEADAATAMNDHARARDAAVRAIVKSERRGARLLVARARAIEGIALHQLGRTEEGIAAQQAALAIYRDLGDGRGVGSTLVRIGSIRIFIGAIEAAREDFLAALRVAAGSGDTSVQQTAWNNLAFCSFMAGDPRQAEDLLQQMLQLARELEDQRIEAAAIANIGYAQYLRGELDRAEESFQAAYELARTRELRQMMAVSQTNSGDVLLARGELARAREAYESALSLRESLRDRRGVAESRIALANAALEERRGADAEALARATVAWALEARVWDIEALGRTAWARALLQQQRIDEADRQISLALKLVNTHQNVVVRIAAGTAAARVAAAAGRAGDAQRIANETLRIASRGTLILPRAEAALAAAEVAPESVRRAQLAEAGRYAAARGFTLIARKAQR